MVERVERKCHDDSLWHLDFAKLCVLSAYSVYPADHRNQSSESQTEIGDLSSERLLDMCDFVALKGQLSVETTL